MSERRIRWLLWLGLFFLLPLPLYFATSALLPAARLLFLTGLIFGSTLAEGRGSISDLFLLISLVQLAGYFAITWGLAYLAARLISRFAPQRAGWVLGSLLVLGVAAASTGSVYRTPFNVDSLTTDLLGLYTPAQREALPVRPRGGETTVSTASPQPIAEEQVPCTDRDPQRRPFFGDTHVHTALSFDAVGQGTRNRPRDAYRFARGQAVGIQPYDLSGRASQTVQLRRPLDFAIVTDHAELLGETHICLSPEAEGYDSYVCWLVRRWPRLGYLLVNGDMFSNAPPRRYGFCGEGGAACVRASRAPWMEIQQAAEEAYDRSANCAFTSFVGFEWSGMPKGNNAHRNVVFRNEIVPELPVNYLDTPSEEGLWEALHRDCLDRDTGCDVLAIPHNSNVSNGELFRIVDTQGVPISRELAQRRAALETLVEVTQHKGDSECRRPGAPTADEACGFETPIGSTMREMMSPLRASEPAPLSFVREVLGEGLVQRQRLGANPFQFGLIGSTDTHFGTPGLVDEDRFVGHAAGPVSRLVEVPAMPDRLELNPGGLAVLWAEENSREALFAAMRRREAYGTSGPRMRLRVFGGWEYPTDLCEKADFVAQGYAQGVPMGANLPAIPAAAQTNGSALAPRFAIWALKDPGTEDRAGGNLERIQIVKAWEDSGQAHEQVYDIAGEEVPNESVDLTTCRASERGQSSLCTVWRDPVFDPERHAVYYARVLEVPSCRWNSHVCSQAAVDCSEPESYSNELAACCDPDVPKTIRERAWASPIWYEPEGDDPDRHDPATTLTVGPGGGV